MTIRNEALFSGGAGFDGLFDWDFLDGAFGETIRPMDFDAVVEINRHFLVFETKHPGADVPRGQRTALERLAQLPTFIVVVVWGKTAASITRWEVWDNGKVTSHETGAAGLRAFCVMWASHVREAGRRDDGQAQRSGAGIHEVGDDRAARARGRSDAGHQGGSRRTAWTDREADAPSDEQRQRWRAAIDDADF